MRVSLSSVALVAVVAAALTVAVKNRFRIALATRGAAYRDAFNRAERENGLPALMLARMAYQESGFNPNATGDAGEVGIMQIIPRYHPGVNAADPYQAIKYAGKFVAQLYRQFGRWDAAIAAYNWGPENVKKYPRERWPATTKHYVAGVMSDLAAV